MWSLASLFCPLSSSFLFRLEPTSPTIIFPFCPRCGLSSSSELIQSFLHPLLDRRKQRKSEETKREDAHRSATPAFTHFDLFSLQKISLTSGISLILFSQRVRFIVSVCFPRSCGPASRRVTISKQPNQKKKKKKIRASAECKTLNFARAYQYQNKVNFHHFLSILKIPVFFSLSTKRN